MMTSSNGNIFLVAGLCVCVCGGGGGGGGGGFTSEFPSQRPVTRSFDVFVDLRLNKRMSIIDTPVIWDTIAPIMTSV